MLTLRPATESDLEFLADLRRVTMWKHFENSGLPVDETDQLARLLHRFDCARIITISGEDIGLLKIARDVDPWELIQIQLLPKHQRKGLGKALLEVVLAEAEAAEKSVVLGVLRANPAQRLYERLGFRVIGESDSAYRMRFDARHVAPGR
jgi:ribosomal protein S18 acetylase RimI-like enzyme